MLIYNLFNGVRYSRIGLEESTFINMNVYSWLFDLSQDAVLFDEVYDQRSVNSAPEMVPHWPGSDVKVGQVGGVAVDTNNEVVIFHRGSRKWEYK